MIDTFARAGSCSQIGKNCHISAGSGVGGVLEPAQALPTIIEDNVFLGAMSEVVEGVIVGNLISSLANCNSFKIFILNLLKDRL